MTPERLTEIELRAAAATSGPWQMLSECPPGEHHHDWDEIWVGTSDRATIAVVGERYTAAPAEAEFIAHARTDVPDLVVEVRRLRAERDAALALHQPTEDQYTDQWCAECGGGWECATVRALSPVAETAPPS
jgi:hypothetical protein